VPQQGVVKSNLVAETLDSCIYFKGQLQQEDSLFVTSIGGDTTGKEVFATVGIFKDKITML